MSKTKIVCTLGPSTDSEDALRQILRAGGRVFRLNFSHDTHEQQAWRAETVRKLADEEDTHVAVMADLQGPKLRIGEIASGTMVLEEGAPFVLTARPVPGAKDAVHFGQREVIHDLRPGDRIMLDDGLLELRVQRVDGEDALTQVVVGGELSSRKGVSLPDTTLRLGSLTPKDCEDARFAASLDVDYIALSFVRLADNVHDLRAFLEDCGAGDIPIVAKIEKREALDRFDEILEASDGIMVARGDLGVEIPPEDVPIHQKAIVKRCNAAGKPVIIATQMLQSMMDNPRPTRAEASDVANAILDGTDAIMLSGETAVGRYPVGAVETMVRIARSTELHFPYSTWLYQLASEQALTVTDAISQATCEIAAELDAKAIVTSTRSGYTARMVAKYRPATPILASTPNPKVAARLSLVWGVEPIQMEDSESTDEMIKKAVQAAKAKEVLRSGDLAVITAGVPIGGPGRTNMLKVHRVE